MGAGTFPARPRRHRIMVMLPGVTAYVSVLRSSRSYFQTCIASHFLYTPPDSASEQPDQACPPDARYPMADSFRWIQTISTSLPANIVQDRLSLQSANRWSAGAPGSDCGRGRALPEPFLSSDEAGSPGGQLHESDIAQGGTSQEGIEGIEGVTRPKCDPNLRVGLHLAA